MTRDRSRDDRDPDNNPLGLGPNDRESANTGSVADTSYNAAGSDPYTTGEPRKDFGRGDRPAPDARDARSVPADPAAPSSDEP